MFISTAALAGTEDLWERLDAFEAAGIRAVELGAGVAVADDPASLADLLARRGLELLVHNYFPPPREPFVLNLASPDEEARTRSVRFVERALELSAALGAPFYSVHAGWVTDPVGFGTSSFVLAEPTGPAPRAEAWGRFESSLSHLLDRAERAGVSLLVENNVCVPEMVGKVLLDRPGDVDELVARLDSPRLGLLVDFGHLKVAATTHGYPTGDFLDAAEPHVQAVHLHDNDGDDDTHRPAGAWVLAALRRPGFRSAVPVIEARFDALEPLVAHLRDLEAAVHAFEERV